MTLDKPGKKIRLASFSEKPPKGLTEKKCQQEFDALCAELFDLQDLLWGARQHAVMVVLQGRDSAGKDGTIKHVVGCLNPRGVHVTSFSAPTEEEREHDFLWRIHRHAPRRGEFAIFNRSHYEDVLVARVNKLVPKALWKHRYGHIRDFEELLSEHGTIVLKFFLHISLDEQEKRLLKREEEPRKSWKISAGDWKDRDHWDDYTEAYEDALSRTATKTAPWTIVPAESKWYRNLVVARTIAEALRPHRKAWQAQLDAVGENKKAELAQYRQQK
ncbi:polyphosphate kinase 2 family protein [Stigmatella sp. ncwal1]|uniref:Polyphosphate kinase 2 family protein n=1 Tax=Stigmatella ashevillensis TaxID=2995309 RepID=A0ABT5D8I1_9BACT|nr:PPK2 family polyphosphate kinase [Stigmatella ashevillena]MDC0709939.1 polyphosphate kinase 2 family protein [Stigmatella ashevillena]